MNHFSIKTIFFLIFFSIFKSFGQQTGLGLGVNFYPYKVRKSISRVPVDSLIVLTDERKSDKLTYNYRLEHFKIIQAEGKRRTIFLDMSYLKYTQIDGKISISEPGKPLITTDETVKIFSAAFGLDFLKKRNKILSNEKLSVWSGWTYRLPFSNAKNSYTDTRFFTRDSYKLGLNVAYKATLSYLIGKKSFIELCIIPPLQLDMGMNYSISNNTALPIASRRQLQPIFDINFRPELQLGMRFILQEKEEKKKKMVKKRK